MGFIYEFPTWPVVAFVSLLMFIANEIGFRIARLRAKDESDLTRQASGVVKGSVVCLRGLLLAFSFLTYSGRQRPAGSPS
jgi:hypothetical protein